MRIVTTKILFLVLISLGCFADRFVCVVGETGLTKDDFQFLFINANIPQELSTKNIIVTEFPANSGIYIISNLPLVEHGNYYFYIAYQNQIRCEYRFPTGSCLSGGTYDCRDYNYLLQSNRTWAEGDTKPSITLVVNDFPYPPVNFGCSFKAKSEKNRIIEGECFYTYERQKNGKYKVSLSYDWKPSDLETDENSTYANYEAQFVFSDGSKIYTFPLGERLSFVVRKRL